DFTGAAATPALPAPLRALDSPRRARAAAVCDKLEAELRASPERVREFIGGSDEVIAALRRTSEDLARRELELRAEADLAQLDEERVALEKQIAAAGDEQIRASLRGAMAALEEQKKQRAHLRLSADRLEAEHTRLLYTLEGLA